MRDIIEHRMVMHNEETKSGIDIRIREMNARMEKEKYELGCIIQCVKIYLFSILWRKLIRLS